MSYCVFDCETTGLDSFQGDVMFAFCLAFIDGDRIRVDVYRLDEGDRERLRAIAILQTIMSDLIIEVIGHNIKFDLKFARALGIVIPEGKIFHDTMIMSQLLNNLAPSHGLKDLAWRYRKIPRDTEKEVKRIAQARGGYHRVPKHIMEKYQKEDGENPMCLFLLWLPIFKKDPVLWEDYRNEMELIVETIHMEEFGIKLDIHGCRKMLSWLEEELHGVTKLCLSMFGEIPNLNSNDQVNYLLYKKLKMPILKYNEGGSASSDKDTVTLLRETHPHPFLDAILKQRSYTKGISMLNGYMEHADSNYIIHPNIKTNEARTGRQSSERPNLQNVSKELTLKNPFAVPLRRVFRCHSGHVMPLVDYAGIELRLIIDRAGEESLIELLRAGGDPHNECGQVWYGDWVRPELRWSGRVDKAARKPLRDAGKNATFGKGYGAALPKIANTLGLSIEETQPGFREFCKRWPKVAYYTAISSRRVLESGHIRTAFGRKLNVDREHAYAGANYDIQGTAAGILKRAQVRIGKFLRKKYPEVRMVLPVHDELIFSYPRTMLGCQEEVVQDVSKIMTTMPEIQAPLEVEWKQTTTTWADARDLKFK